VLVFRKLLNTHLFSGKMACKLQSQNVRTFLNLLILGFNTHDYCFRIQDGLLFPEFRPTGVHLAFIRRYSLAGKSLR
jgi:hypothetical protein